MNPTNPNHPLARLRHHVTGAIERGEAQAIIEQPNLRPVSKDEFYARINPLEHLESSIVGKWDNAKGYRFEWKQDRRLIGVSQSGNGLGESKEYYIIR